MMLVTMTDEMNGKREKLRPKFRTSEISENFLGDIKNNTCGDGE